MDTKTTFNNEANEYEQTSRAVNIFFDESINTFVKNIKIKTSKPLRVLDVCCGTGILTEKVANQFPDAEFVGLDFAQNMLTIANDRMKNYNFTSHCFDVLDTKKFALLGKFDLIISSFGLHNIHKFEQKQMAINNIFNVLKTGGQFINLDYILGKDKKECKHFTKFFIKHLLLTYNKKETKNWLKLLAEEDKPETLQDNFKLLTNAKFKDVSAIWQKEYLAILMAKK